MPSPTLTPTVVPPQGMIAFHTELNGAWSINAISPDGTNLRRISDARGDTYTPALSPDGRRLAFVSRRDSGNPDIWIMDVGSNTAQRITRHPAEDWGPAWSPDGRLLAFHSNRERNYELYVVDPVELVARRLTYTGARIDNADASWSPDGREILFASNRDGGGLFIIGADGSGERRLTPPGYQGHDPAWSPDGRMIAYQSRRSADDDDWQIFVMDIDKLEPRQLTFVGNNERAAWSPDGRYIAFQSNRDGKQEIYLIGVDGSGERRVTSSPGNNGWPTWALDPNAPPPSAEIYPAATPPEESQPPAGAPAVTSVVVIVNPESVTGPCPQTFLYTAAITVSAPGAILYQWEAGDGTTRAPTALLFPAGQLTQTVSLQATYDRTGTFYHLLRVLAPVLYTTDRATAALTCSP
jgi:TolB protein